MSDFSVEKVQKAADDLGIEFNSDNPTDFGDMSDIPKWLEESYAINMKNYFKDVKINMTREKKVKYLIELIEIVEGVNLPTEHFKEFSDEKLDSEIEFYDYVSEK